MDQSVKMDPRTYDNIRKIMIGQRDDYTTRGPLVVCLYFKQSFKLIAINLTKQQALGADLKATRWIHFTGNLNGPGQTILFYSWRRRKKYCSIIGFFT